MIFAWDQINREHIAKHSVSEAEAEEIARDAEAPFPREVGDDKLLVWGATRAGRFLQVIYVLKLPVEVDYESVAVEDWMEIEANEFSEIVCVIHAMEMTDGMKRQLRRRRR